MKLFKRLLWVLGVIVVLCVGAVVVVTNLVDPNDYKPQLEDMVETNTGRQLKINGDLALTFYPWVGISTGELSLSNRAGFGDEPMVYAEQVDIKVKLIPLLKERFEIGKIILNKAEIRLITKYDGTTNWDDLLERGGKSDKDTDADDAMAIAGVAIQGVSLRDGLVIWDDRSADQLIEITNLNLATGTLKLDDPLGVEFSADIGGNVLSSPASIVLSTTVKASPTSSAISLEESVLNFETNDLPMEIRIPWLSLKLSEQSLNIPEFTLVQGETNINGRINGSRVMTTLAIEGQLELKSSSLGKTLSDAGMGGLAEIIAGDAESSTEFRFYDNVLELQAFESELVLNGQDTRVEIPFFSLDLTSENVSAPALDISQSGIAIDVSFKGQNILSEVNKLKLQGSLNINTDDITAVLAQNQLDDLLPDGLFQSVKSVMDFGVGNGNLVLSSMNTVIDEMRLKGNFSVDNLLGDYNLLLSVKHDINNIDIGKVLAALDITDDLEGTGAIRMNLAGINPSIDGPMDQVDGHMGFNFTDGAIKGFDLQSALIKLDQDLNAGNAENEESKYQPDAQTRFSELSGDFNGVNGVFQTNNVSMKAPAARIRGNGKLDFPENFIHILFDVSVVDTVEGQGGAALENLDDVTIPLRVAGNMQSPGYGLDVGELLKREVRQKVSQELEEEQAKLEDKAKDKLKNLSGDD